MTDVWIAGFLFGYWYYLAGKDPPWRDRVERHGMAAHLINVPLGHPGDCLSSPSGRAPTAPPRHWKMAVLPDGQTYSGTSLHEPATAENCEAMRQIQAAGVKRVFLDDDFRLARSPGMIGGCFCPEHKKAFLCNAPATAKPNGANCSIRRRPAAVDARLAGLGRVSPATN